MKMLILLIHLLGLNLAAAEALQLTSPDGQFRADISVRADGTPVYQVAWQGKPLILESALGLELEQQAAFGGLSIVSSTASTHDESWTPVCGERKSIRDHYNELSLELKETAAPGRRLDLVFRAYDTGLAFHYLLPKQAELKTVVIKRELSQFRFPADHSCWAVPHAQGIYSRVPLTRMPAGTERPLLVEAGADQFIALAEARLRDYARTKFSPLEDGKPGVCTQLGSSVSGSLPLRSPWRVILAATSPGQLLMNNSLILNLNDPCSIGDTSWIKPGTVLREMTLSTAGAKRSIDYCAAHHIPYMMFDAGWYGKENDDKADARGVHLDPERSQGPLDLQEVLRHAESRKIGVILYVNYKAMSHQLKEILPLYRQWGVKGVKYGFVRTGGQQPTDFVNEAIRLASENHLMVDIHDDWRPTGTERTWPNLMTCEGIAGDEEGKRTNAQSLVYQYARYLAGPADNTFCYFDPRVDRLTNHACQLAKTICFYSPWQFLYWYDRVPAPGDSLSPGDHQIGDEPELAFFDRLPTTWDDSRVLGGALAEYSVLARRKGEAWWLGAMNADTPRQVQLKLDFLRPGVNYEATLYTHDPAVATRSHVKISKLRVDVGSLLDLKLGANDGAALEILPLP